MKEIGIKALEAKDFLSTVTTQEKNKALLAIAQSLRNSSETIINENKTDLENGSKNGLSAGMLDRLLLDQKRIEDIAKAVEDVAALPDPCGRLLEETTRYGGRSGALPEKFQCRDPARRQRGNPFQYCDRSRYAQRACRLRI